MNNTLLNRYAYKYGCCLQTLETILVETQREQPNLARIARYVTSTLARIKDVDARDAAEREALR